MPELSTLNPNHFLALRTLLDTEPQPVPAAPVWPHGLSAGEYLGDGDRLQQPALNQLRLWRSGDRPGLGIAHTSGHVIATTLVTSDPRPVWLWQVQWDDGSGQLRSEVLSLEIYGDHAFRLHTQGGYIDYQLETAEVIEPTSFWPAPLRAGAYLAEQPELTDMARLQWHDYADTPLLESSQGITGLYEMEQTADGLISACLQWHLYEGSEELSPRMPVLVQVISDQQFALQIADGPWLAYRLEPSAP